MLYFSKINLKIINSVNEFLYFILRGFWFIIYIIIYYIPRENINKYNIYFKYLWEKQNYIEFYFKKENYVVKKIKVILKLDYDLSGLLDLQLIINKMSTKYNVKNIIIYRPYKKLTAKSLKKFKMLIRAAKPFTKTRYSIIRQECKNIVAFTLLLNLISIATFFNIYLKINIIPLFYQTFFVLFIFYNVNLLFQFNKNLLNFCLNFNSYRKWLGFNY